MLLAIGIDPGLDGGLATMTEAGDIHAIPMPTVTEGKKRVLDLDFVCDFMTFNTKTTSSIACLERVGPGPKGGRVSMFNFGRTFGMLEGLLFALNIPTTLVTPQAWQKAILEGVPGKPGEKRSIPYCLRKYPNTSLMATPRCTKHHDGMADAICLAEYALRSW